METCIKIYWLTYHLCSTSLLRYLYVLSHTLTVGLGSTGMKKRPESSIDDKEENVTWLSTLRKVWTLSLNLPRGCSFLETLFFSTHNFGKHFQPISSVYPTAFYFGFIVKCLLSLVDFRWMSFLRVLFRLVPFFFHSWSPPSR